jgi:hypothetical protein
LKTYQNNFFLFLKNYFDIAYQNDIKTSKNINLKKYLIFLNTFKITKQESEA